MLDLQQHARMVAGVSAFTCGLIAGLMIGVPLGAYLAWERFLRYQTPPIRLSVTPEVMDLLVAEWCKKRSLAVMPKGKEFTWPGEILP